MSPRRSENSSSVKSDSAISSSAYSSSLNILGKKSSAFFPSGSRIT